MPQPAVSISCAASAVPSADRSLSRVRGIGRPIQTAGLVEHGTHPHHNRDMPAERHSISGKEVAQRT